MRRLGAKEKPETARGRSNRTTITIPTGKNEVGRCETARWILKRSTSTNPGRINEAKRLTTEQQIRKVFDLWDADKLGALSADGIMSGLSAIGLGATPQFLLTVVSSCFPPPRFSGDSVRFEDFSRCCQVDSARSRLIKTLDSQALMLAYAVGDKNEPTAGGLPRRQSLRLAKRFSAIVCAGDTTRFSRVGRATATTREGARREARRSRRRWEDRGSHHRISPGEEEAAATLMRGRR